MAEPWALRHKRWKKRSTWHSSSRRTSARGLPARPVAARDRPPPRLAPGRRSASCPTASTSPPSRPARAVGPGGEHPELAGKFVLLFFGRVHVKKGLDLLAEALGRLAPDFPELHVLVAGNDDGAWAPFRERIGQLGLTERVTYVGHVGGERPARSGPRPTPSSCPATARASAWPSSRLWPARSPA